MNHRFPSAPAGVIEFVRYVEGDDARDVDEVFDWRPLPAEPYHVGPFRLESWGLPHYVPKAGIRLIADDPVVARVTPRRPGTDRSGEGPRPADRPGVASRATADDRACVVAHGRRVAMVAAEAGVRKLLLVHFRPGWDRREYVAEAQRHFAGEVIAAADGLVVPLRT
jgi:hypothetical protein